MAGCPAPALADLRLAAVPLPLSGLLAAAGFDLAAVPFLTRSPPQMRLSTSLTPLQASATSSAWCFHPALVDFAFERDATTAENRARASFLQDVSNSHFDQVFRRLTARQQEKTWMRPVATKRPRLIACLLK